MKTLRTKLAALTVAVLVTLAVTATAAGAEGIHHVGTRRTVTAGSPVVDAERGPCMLKATGHH